MTELYEKAYAKLNLSLDVKEKREDGYHNMTMVMQSISLCDDIRLTLNKSGEFTAASNYRYLPHDDKNLAVKAARLFLERAPSEYTGAELQIHKRIPAGAGMGGGSSDAAAVLRMLNRHFGSPLDSGGLLALADEIGSDVAFCIHGGTMLAEGRGEILSPLPQIPECSFLICKPGFSISTPELFRKLDGCRLRMHPDTQGLIGAIRSGDIVEMCRRMYNVFEDVGDRRMRTIAEIKSRLLDAGAAGAVMTGTGSAVFGVFPKDADFGSLEKELEKEYGFCRSAVPVGTTE